MDSMSCFITMWSPQILLTSPGHDRRSVGRPNVTNPHFFNIITAPPTTAPIAAAAPPIISGVIVLIA
jgi:hypothetical protein